MAFKQTYHNVGNVINIETLHGNLTLGADGSAAFFPFPLPLLRSLSRRKRTTTCALCSAHLTRHLRPTAG